MRSDFYSLPYAAQMAIRKGENDAARARRLLHEVEELRSRSMVPDGWKLVPVEPTEAMIRAGLNEIIDCATTGAVWSAMLSAAPSQENDRG